MPVTKTAKRALRVAKRNLALNTSILTKMEKAIRLAKKGKTPEKIIAAISIADKAAKKRAIHRNKAARIKSALSKLLSKAKPSAKTKVKPAKRTSKK